MEAMSQIMSVLYIPMNGREICLMVFGSEEARKKESLDWFLLRPGKEPMTHLLALK